MKINIKNISVPAYKLKVGRDKYIEFPARNVISVQPPHNIWQLRNMIKKAKRQKKALFRAQKEAVNG